jgi:hypothetical protein
MEIFENFNEKDFTEQVIIIKEVESKKLQEAIPDLLGLCKEKDKDSMVQYMAENSLKLLMSENEAATADGIKNGASINIKKICCEISGINKFASTVPALIEIIDLTNDNSLLFEALSALKKINPRNSLNIFEKHESNEDPIVSSLCKEALNCDNNSEPV